MYPGAALDTIFFNLSRSNTTSSNEEYEQIFHCQLPKPSENVDQLRTDLKEYGYCYVKNAMTATQLNNLTKRIQEQADAEKEAGVAYLEGVSTFHYHKPKKGDTL